MIDHFTLEQFEDALPKHKVAGTPLWKSRGFQYGEHIFTIQVKREVFIYVRSSVRANGMSAGEGQDSIRAYLVDRALQPLGTKTQKYVTRKPGWEGRMTNMLRELYRRGKAIKNCPHCNKPQSVRVVKKQTKNKGRIFQACNEHFSETFEYLQ